MKILVIFTGGTIGSTLKDGWISPDGSSRRTLMDNYKNRDAIEFRELTPYTVLSENLSSVELNKLVRSVNQNIHEDYDGIIVTHGTDAIQYSAAALAFSLPSDCNPVVIVSSNYPLDDERANGNANFDAAVEFIKSGLGHGVFVSYRNSKAETEILRGTRLLVQRETSDELCNLGDEPYAYYRDGNVVLNEKYVTSDSGRRAGAFELVRHPGILVIQSMPGDRYSYTFAGVNAVIIRPYHSGTINTSSIHLHDFCSRARAAGIPVFITDVPGGDAYESSKEFRSLGVVTLPYCGFIPMYVKLWIGVSIGADLTDFMTTPLRDEFL